MQVTFCQIVLGTLMKISSMLLIGCAICGLTTAANAGLVYSAPLSTGDLGSPGSFSATFGAIAGPGLLTFNLEGYNTLDGNGCCADTFTLSLNGTVIWQGEYSLGGNGTNVTDFQPAGSVIIASSSGYNLGGNVAASIPLDLLSGLNTLAFSYSGKDQGLSDEGWGTNSTLVTDSAVAAVPEPATWISMLAGLLCVGFTMRRRTGIKRLEA
jgi:hypothetical protein